MRDDQGWEIVAPQVHTGRNASGKIVVAVDAHPYIGTWGDAKAMTETMLRTTKPGWAVDAKQGARALDVVGPLARFGAHG